MGCAFGSKFGPTRISGSIGSSPRRKAADLRRSRRSLQLSRENRRAEARDPRDERRVLPAGLGKFVFRRATRAESLALFAKRAAQRSRTTSLSYVAYVRCMRRLAATTRCRGSSGNTEPQTASSACAFASRRARKVFEFGAPRRPTGICAMRVGSPSQTRAARRHGSCCPSPHRVTWGSSAKPPSARDAALSRYRPAWPYSRRRASRTMGRIRQAARALCSARVEHRRRGALARGRSP